MNPKPDLLSLAYHFVQVWDNECPPPPGAIANYTNKRRRQALEQYREAAKELNKWGPTTDEHLLEQAREIVGDNPFLYNQYR